MNEEQLILWEKKGDLCEIWLNRPEKGNAINSDLIRELNILMQSINEDDTIRYVILGGTSNTFCSGADLQWMKQAGELDFEENVKESLKLAELYHQMFYSNKILIARITGACYGGGIGLAAVCDFVFGTPDSKYSFSEVRLGLVPATIAPYVIHRTSGHKAKKVMLTGEKLSAKQMQKLGIVDTITDGSSIDEEIMQLIDALREGGKRAQQGIKQLISDLNNITDWRDVKHYTSEILARARSSAEGKEGINAFLEKRRPNWESHV
jgi:methylglutaconyl-CoA hydratase